MNHIIQVIGLMFFRIFVTFKKIFTRYLTLYFGLDHLLDLTEQILKYFKCVNLVKRWRIKSIKRVHKMFHVYGEKDV